MLNFNIPPFVGKELKYIRQAINNHKICGDGEFTKKCNCWFEHQFNIQKALLTTSCTHALEMSAILANIQPGDEVIAPSFTFVSSVNSFVLRGARIKFIDIRPDTMNLNERLIENAITKSTKVILPVHYAGVACEMDSILKIAQKYNLIVIEDAAQGVMSKYKNQYLGSIGDIGTYSFHETKNYSMGEGGAILLNNKNFVERAEIIREKGTDRSKFFRGQIDKYSWIDIGSSYLPSEINAAYLWAQLELADEINEFRLKIWNQYFNQLSDLARLGHIELPTIPKECKHNAHMFYIKLKDLNERTQLINKMKQNNILAVFHYVPLHTSKAGLKYGEFIGSDQYTTKESDRLLRLPLYYGIKNKEINKVIEIIYNFFAKKI